jgi:serine/threonine protein kinase
MTDIALEIRFMSNDYLRSHPNIIDLMAITWEEVHATEGQPGFVRPILLVELSVDDFGQPFTLDRFLLQHAGKLRIEQKTEILCDIASGLSRTHALAVVHGDLKPGNILMCQDPVKGKGRYVAKLSDFGFSTIEVDPNAVQRGTFLWNAPECLSEACDDFRPFRNTITRDFYSFGLVIWYGASNYGLLISPDYSNAELGIFCLKPRHSLGMDYELTRKLLLT